MVVFGDGSFVTRSVPLSWGRFFCNEECPSVLGTVLLQRGVSHCHRARQRKIAEKSVSTVIFRQRRVAGKSEKVKSMSQYILDILRENSEEKFREFQSKLMPTVDPATIMGVRTPVLRKLAKQLIKEDKAIDFLHELPHKYFDENQLHGFIISELKDYNLCIDEINRFLPYIDNWATCDQTSPKVFKKHKGELIKLIPSWIASGETYTIRFAVGMLMQFYLDEDFDEEYLSMVTSIKSEEYYVNMEIAWYMATALAKQWDATIPYIEGGVMSTWTHNKTIQKARESYRITDNQKEYLKSLKKRAS